MKQLKGEELMATLYELTGQYLQLLEMAQDADPETFADTLDGMDGEIEEKADNYAKVIRTLSGDIDSIDVEIDRLKNRKNTISNNMERIKKSLETSMIITNKRKFKTVLFSFGIQKNRPVVQIKQESAVPKQFWKTQDPVIDKQSLLDYVKEHGNTAYAELTQSESLRIR